MSKFRLLSIILLTLIFSNTFTFSQSTGKISGKVTDHSTSEEIPFANIYVEGTNEGAAADIDGNFTILNLKPGLYTVTASVVGYQKVSVENVRVNVDFTTRLDFQLSTGAIDLPAVIVQGERNPLIRQDLTNPTIAITEENIKELPVDQISDVIRLQAGVVQGDDGQLHVRGGYGNEIAFTLNGISVNDPYANQRAIGVATNAVQEVSVSTGTFSAQYGNALSGVVNYVTKEGGEKYSLSLRSYAGDYVTNRTSLFDKAGYEDIDPLNRARLEATMGGPIPALSNARFYLSGVFENFRGIYYGQRLYNPTDSYLSRENFKSSDSRSGSNTDPYYFNPYYDDADSLHGSPTGDGGLVAMNPSTSWNIQGNLSYKLSPRFKIKYEAVYDKGQSQSYSNSWKYNPDGRGTNYSEGLVQSLDITHTLSDKVFYTLKGSYGYNSADYYLYKNVDDSRYLPSNVFLKSVGNTFFYSGGTDNYRQARTTKTIGLKGDIVAQLFTSHEFKAGFELRLHDLEFEGYSVEFLKDNGNGTFGNISYSDYLYDSTLSIIRRKPVDNAALYTYYQKKPTQFAAYFQDKIELASTLILNAGIRYEMFNPASEYNPNISKNLVDSLAGDITAYNISSDIKHSISPRISVSYPITDRGVIRFSYGHFYQIGSLSSLYSNPNYYVTNFGSVPTFGNANVEPQKSVQYEIGLQQQLTEDFKFDLTGFYKDVANYIYTQTIFTATGRQYNLLTNLSYANTRGITLSFLKRRAPGSIFSASLDYTFSIAEGNRTEPTDELFFSEAAGKQTETFLVPLSFDRSHVINGTVTVSEPEDWAVGMIFNLQTGSPYTPSLPSDLVDIRYEQNSAIQNLQWNVDIKLEKYFAIGAFKYSVFLQVENLFDTANELFVYASSGRALTN
ncbi:MAG: TonB-dependent receptor, partial [Ignavibacteriaceae bacterium]|nr:TonB-dependent receptor [Ignavibacteriaceae bacterium]